MATYLLVLGPSEAILGSSESRGTQENGEQGGEWQQAMPLEAMHACLLLVLVMMMVVVMKEER